MAQGNLLSMILCGLALVPLAEELRKAVPEVVQPWCADDSAMAGPASRILTAVTLLQEWGPRRGHCPEPAKSVVVCGAQARPRVEATLATLPVQCCDGPRCVGGFLGHNDRRSKWLDPQIQKWTRAVRTLARIARRCP